MTKELRTPQQWWDSVKRDPAAITAWLKNQYHGEATACDRINEFSEKYAPRADKFILDVIARQEAIHADWIGELLLARGVTPEILDKEERYWDKTLPDIHSWESGCAVAAQAEMMRLERIRVIVEDRDTPEDIRKVFERILPQEEFHERAFFSFTTLEALAKTSANQVKGIEALGLVL